MAKNKAVPSMVQSDGTLKRIISYDYTERNYRRIFLNQALPALGLFANRAACDFKAFLLTLCKPYSII